MRVSIAVVALLVLSACPPKYPKCDSDQHCAEKGEVCVQGRCQECATDNNCKSGFVCDANKCVPKPECTDNNPCSGSKKCTRGKCLVEELAKQPGACAVSEDCQTGEDCKAGRCAPKGSTGGCALEPVRFDFNESKLNPEGQTALAVFADCIKKAGWNVRAEGHADERGTEEYNLQLSNRRAAAVKRYLVDLGVSEGVVDTVGYGENKPAVVGSTEAAWAANRRVELVKR